MIAAIGPATADALRANFLRPDIEPDASYTTEGLAQAILAGGSWRGQRALLARADIATPALPDALRAGGAVVDELVVYQTALPAALPEEAVKSLQAGRADWITFTSSSSVRNLLSLAKSAGLPAEAIRQAKLAAIGPVTAQTLQELLRKPDVVAQPHTAEGLVAAILAADVGR
jgi:uroporphyrinogen III methyltransferase/synthase